MNVASKIAKESTITFSGLLYGNINRYLYTALLARWVGAEFLGIYSLANAIMLISEVLAKMGLETGIMRFVSQLDPDFDKVKIQKVIGSALKMTFISSLIIRFAVIISSGSIVAILSEASLLKSVIIIFSITIPFNALTSVAAFATQGFKRLKYKILVTQFLNPTVLLISMIFSYWFISVESAIMIPMFTVVLIGFIVMMRNLKSVSGFNHKQLLRSPFDVKLLQFSYPLMFVAMLQTFMHWIDILMLGYFIDAGIVGLYHPAARTAGLLQALLLSFLIISQITTGFGMAIMVVGMGSIMADIADDQELQTGKRQEGLIFSFIGLASKATSGVGHFLAGLTLSLISFPTSLRYEKIICASFIFSRNLVLLSEPNFLKR